MKRFIVSLEWGEENTLNWTRDELETLRREGILGGKIELAHGGYLWLKQPLQTVRGEFIEGADFKIYRAGRFTVLELHPNPRSRWWSVLSPEVIRLLKQFTKAEPLLICGYRDDTDLTKLGFEHNNRLMFINWLPEAIKTGKLEVLPSALTAVKKELLNLEDGLYELIERPGSGEREYVLVKTIDSYKLLVSIGEIDLTDEESTVTFWKTKPGSA